MTLTYPYPLPYLADQLKIASVIFDAQRNDELSGTGDGRIIAAELSPPLWVADVTLISMTNDAAKQAAAKIRALNGAQESFLLYDPLSKYPQADPMGSILGNSAVTVATGANRSVANFAGLPAGYVLTVGDKFQIINPGDAQRVMLLEISETKAASGGGAITDIAVFPHLPQWLTESVTAILKKPAGRFIIMPGTHKPGQATRELTSGISFRAIQRR